MATRVLLLQDAAHLPSFGGGNKANRLLLEALAARGFDCRMVSRAPGDRGALSPEFGARGLAARGVSVEADGGYRFRGVGVSPMDFATPDAGARLAALVADFDPDWILASDDRPGLFLGAGLRHAPERTIALVHTHYHLPFGPEAEQLDPVRHDQLRRARGVVAVSEYSRGYLREWGGIESKLLRFPVFGSSSFAPPAPPGGFVAMINPCHAKGLPIFLALAERFPATPFAAAPTWGADAAVLEALTRLPNMTILDPADDIGALLARVRVLLAPSMAPETFGYVAIDAMLRGVPVLAGDLGGQPEAKLGVDFVLPVDGAIEAWAKALETLLADPHAWRRLSEQSRAAARRFLPETDADHFIRYLDALSVPARGAPLPDRRPAARG